MYGTKIILAQMVDGFKRKSKFLILKFAGAEGEKWACRKVKRGQRGAGQTARIYGNGSAFGGRIATFATGRQARGVNVNSFLKTIGKTGFGGERVENVHNFWRGRTLKNAASRRKGIPGEAAPGAIPGE